LTAILIFAPFLWTTRILPSRVLQMDFLPVVLLVQGHFCLDATKVDVALSKIHPKGVVKYMIIYNPSTSTTLHLEDVHSLQFSGSGGSSYKEHQHAPFADFPSIDWPFLTLSNSDHVRSGSHGRSLGDEVMNHIGVLSVSPDTGKGTHKFRTLTGRVRVGCPSRMCCDVMCRTFSLDLPWLLWSASA
jgi:hypothetical protein